MADYTAVADVTETLVVLLRDNMAPLLTPSQVQAGSPADLAGSGTRLGLFLFHVLENTFQKNQQGQTRNNGTLNPPPLTVDLYYLLSSYESPNVPDLTERSLEAQRVLGRAMRILYDHSLLAGTILQGNLAGSREEIRVLLHPINVEDMSRLWNTFPEQVFRLSAGYLASPVPIDSLREISTQRVISKEMNYYQKGGK
ncbi:MAG: DUF4255 domain-containing protein [Calditrichia bacterium]